MAARVGVAASGDLESGSTSTNTSAASNASSSPSNLASSADNAPNVPMDRDSKAELYVTDQTRSQSIFLFFFVFFLFFFSFFFSFFFFFLETCVISLLRAFKGWKWLERMFSSDVLLSNMHPFRLTASRKKDSIFFSLGQTLRNLFFGCCAHSRFCAGFVSRWSSPSISSSLWAWFS
jgi:hypothetical protein